MYRAPSTTLRYGIAIGLALTLVGMIIKQLLGISIIMTLGLLVITLTPLTSLLTISIILARRRDVYGFLLSQLVIIFILISIAISIHK